MNRAIIFAHYDIDGIIDPYVVEAINVYRRHADILLLVSASATSLPQELRETVDHFIPRSNVGYDFGSWKAGWLALKQRDSFDEIVFANDSVYGPLVDLPPALNAKKCVGADFWGMVLSEARETHVQSWFAGARQPVIRSGIFNSFWQAAGSDMRDKDELILRLEIGLSRLLVNSGFSLAGIYDGRERPFVTHAERLSHLSISRPFRSIKFIKKTLPWRMPFDPSLLFYRRLWDAGAPFIKRRLFDVNPYALNLRHVIADLKQLAPHWQALIEGHQNRLRRGSNKPFAH
jgi:lipopolysaccharide biosynthesis protein